jgi:serine/threonine-protein kinase
MPPELPAGRWARIEALFDHAVELTAAERAHFLDAECRDDAALRQEVDSLLAEHDAEPAFLETPAPWTPAGEDADDAPAEAIGPYRVLRLLGRGGMGQVWLAERQEPGFRQQVALKLMRRGMDSDDLIARFRTERQILASLNHANIARLLDIGATAQGRLFLVMEYVDGIPLVDYCDQHRLDVRQRLQLCRSICAAVHHAHRSLIVHRDIKPGNILVTAEGVPKLLDFGIAKMLDARGDFASPHTRPDVRLLTPEFSAPEQLRGEPVTTACDVYALGIMLYLLLAGRHPFAGAATRAELERRILEEEPSPPSAGLTEAAAAARRAALPQLERQLRGDLDTVVLKALRKEPDARFASVLSLSDDLERYLTGRPVQARPATAGYRLRKFVARNRVAVTAAAGLAGVLVASTAITLYQSRRVREQSLLVGRERDKALEVRGFLLEMFGTTGPDQATGDTVTARQLLDRRAATLADAYPDDPEMRAEMMFVLAEGYEKLGLPAQAEPLARQSLETRRSQLGRNHADVVASLDLLGWVLHRLDQTDQAEATLREAVTIGRTVFPATGDVRMARALNDLGVVREAKGDYDEAATLYRESLAMRALLPGEGDIGVAVTTSNLAVVLYRKGDLAGAVQAAENALALFRRSLGPDHQRTTVVQSNLAAMQSTRGDHEGAATQQREILERRTRLFGRRHPATASTMTLLASELLALGQPAEAEQLLREALDIQRQADGGRAELIGTLRVLGDVQQRRGRHVEALAAYDSARALILQLYGEAHPEMVAVLSRSAVVHDALGQTGAAEAELRQAAAVAARVFGPARERTLDARLSLIEFLARHGRTEAAAADLSQVERMAAEGGFSENLRRRAQNVRSSLGS